LKGEALELIEKSKKLKRKNYFKEYLFFINIAPVDTNSDFDEESIQVNNKLLGFLNENKML